MYITLSSNPIIIDTQKAVSTVYYTLIPILDTYNNNSHIFCTINNYKYY